MKTAVKNIVFYDRTLKGTKMSKQIQIPDIGSDEVTVTEVMVNVGDTISVDQSIINVEGDKASMEVPAPEAGVVKKF